MAETLEDRALRERLRYDTPFWAACCAKILDDRKQLVPLKPFPWQLELDAKLEAQRDAGLPMRAIILKARKLGFSTWVAAKFLQRLTQMPNQHAIICAQDTDTASVIFQIAHRVWTHLPTEEQLGLGFNIRPEKTGGSYSETGRKYMKFGERSRRLREQGLDDESLLEIDTANTTESGRGYTPSLVHLSEVARWHERATTGPQSKMAALLDAVPHVPETIVVLESTANGMNFFYRRWMLASEGQEDPETGEAYVTHFVPWWRDPRCGLAFSSDAARDRFIDSIGDKRRFGEMVEDEPALVDLYGCTPEQLQWRRMKVAEKSGDIHVFKQEYPASPEEAFITSGRPYFSGILVGKAIKAAEAAPEPVLGTLRGAAWRERKTRAGTIRVPQQALWVPEADAQRDEPLLEVWEHPVTLESQQALPREERRSEGAYIVSADVAEGEADTFTTETDFHAVTVWDHRSRMQVAQYESRIDRHLLPLWLLLVALYYSEAWLVVEVNGPGMAVVDPLAKDYKYRRMYRRRRVDSAANTVERKVGWKTSPESKPLVEDAFGHALQSDTRGGLRSPRGARQLTTYVQDDRGRRGAMPGEHDDLLMAAMIAARVMEEIRPPRDGTRSRSVPGYTVDDEVTGY